MFENPDPAACPIAASSSGFFHWMFQGLGLQQPDNEDFIKRVIGLPGDVVEAQEGQVYVNGEQLDEPYLTQKTDGLRRKTTVPEGKLFVMGDNRGNSLDSRFGLGFVPIDKVIGKAEVIIWPPGDLASLVLDDTSLVTTSSSERRRDRASRPDRLAPRDEQPGERPHDRRDAERRRATPSAGRSEREELLRGGPHVSASDEQARHRPDQQRAAPG